LVYPSENTFAILTFEGQFLMGSHRITDPHRPPSKSTEQMRKRKSLMPSRSVKIFEPFFHSDVFPTFVLLSKTSLCVTARFGSSGFPSLK